MSLSAEQVLYRNKAEFARKMLCKCFPINEINGFEHESLVKFVRDVSTLMDVQYVDESLWQQYSESVCKVVTELVKGPPDEDYESNQRRREKFDFTPISIGWLVNLSDTFKRTCETLHHTQYATICDICQSLEEGVLDY